MRKSCRRRRGRQPGLATIIRCQWRVQGKGERGGMGGNGGGGGGGGGAGS